MAVGGQVYKAVLQGTTVVAVKTVSCTADEKMVWQMMNETRILQRIGRHPNIVHYYSICQSDTPVICMEYMEVGPRTLLVNL